MNIVDQTEAQEATDALAAGPEAKDHYLLRTLLLRGTNAYDRAIILSAPLTRRPKLLNDPWWCHALLELFPDGLPERWLTEAVDARWARWYAERPGAR